MRLHIFILFIFISLSANAQTKSTGISVDTLKQEEELFEVTIDGDVYDALVTTEGDTLILNKFDDDITIIAERQFADPAEKRKYDKMKRYAKYVYPYAQEIIKLYREVEYASENMSKRQRKREIKRLEKELMPKFEDSMKKMTKLQGKIMLKMVEKETGKSTYKIIREVKGRWKAFYWHQASKLYSYNLKEGYQEGKYPILDMVLYDYDLEYKVKNGTDLKYINIDKLRKKKSKKGVK